MTAAAFDTEIEDTGSALHGPWRQPRQMLHAQTYDSHASIHDDATAQKLGFKGGTIEGPTHFSQFAPLCVHLWGDAWFESGCISAHYRSAAYEGEEVQAIVEKPAAGVTYAAIRMVKRDGTEILRGSASLGSDAPPSALDIRLTELKPLTDAVILRDITIGMTTALQTVRMDVDQHMGDLYPFSLADKLKVITEPSPYYSGKDTPWARAIIPMEMLSVLFQHTNKKDGLPVKGPAVGLFADQEIRVVKGPLFVGDDYRIRRKVVAMSGSKRTESLWVRTEVTDRNGDLAATMLLNLATLKESYAAYEGEYAEIVQKEVERNR